jgi:TM2 domain-containing membrane protein YozV
MKDYWKEYELTKLKSSGFAYLLFFFFGVHYLYLNKIGLQILYWLTLGGLGIWAFIDLLIMNNKVNRYNKQLFERIERFEAKNSIKPTN